MKERRRGSIITISSAAGRRPQVADPLLGREGWDRTQVPRGRSRSRPIWYSGDLHCPGDVSPNGTLSAFLRNNLHRWWMPTHSSVWALRKMSHKRQFFSRQVRLVGSPAWCWTLRAER